MIDLPIIPLSLCKKARASTSTVVVNRMLAGALGLKASKEANNKSYSEVKADIKCKDIYIHVETEDLRDIIWLRV